MVTVTINIKPYLAGYMYVRYRQSGRCLRTGRIRRSEKSRQSLIPPLLLLPNDLSLSISPTLLQFITSFINYLSLIRKILHGKKLEIFALYCPNRVMGRIRKSITISETIVH